MTPRTDPEFARWAVDESASMDGGSDDPQNDNILLGNSYTAWILQWVGGHLTPRTTNEVMGAYNEDMLQWVGGWMTPRTCSSRRSNASAWLVLQWVGGQMTPRT